MRAAKRDRNERGFVEAWRSLGALWIPMGPDAGFDGLLIFRGRVHLIEVKDPRRGERYKLTQNELRTLLEVQRRDVEYTVVTNMTEALALVEAE